MAYLYSNQNWKDNKIFLFAKLSGSNIFYLNLQIEWI